MRYLDLAIAALIGTSAIAGVAAFSPRQADSASGGLTLKSELRDELLTFLQREGVAWLVQSTPMVICAQLQELSNSSVKYSGVIGPYDCGLPPPRGAIVATLALHLVSYQVVLEAWSNAPA